MRTLTWTLDPQNTLILNQSLSGRFRISLNGKEILNKVLWWTKKVPFTLNDGRSAEISIQSSFYSYEITLRINGELFLDDQEIKQKTCLHCSTVSTQNKNFCEKCGHALPAAEVQLHIKKLKEARTAIAVVGAVFLIFGIVMYFAQKNYTEQTLRSIAAYQDSDLYPQAINGQKITFGEIRQNLSAGPLKLLVINALLAFFMGALYIYSKKSPLVAILLAGGIYLSVQVLNAILDPMSVNQGLFMKIFICVILFKGTRAALELRKITPGA